MTEIVCNSKYFCIFVLGNHSDFVLFYLVVQMADIIYIGFKWYIKQVHDTMLLRRRYVFGQENLPKEGDRYFIVCNHQNTGNDPLNILFALPQKIRLCAMARANLFEIHPKITSFLHWVGMVPAFRFGWEGANGIDSNFSSFDTVADRINAGYPFVVFPEAGHTQGHYLGRFTSGTVRIAFHAAAQNGWKEDVKILPTATHYSDYFGVQIDFVWKLAPAVSLQPYYEEYQKHPATVMRRLTHQIHDTIQQMMLDEGVSDYETKDFLRLSTLNYPDRDAYPLPERLDKDKAFAARLSVHPQYEVVIAKANELRAKLAEIHISEPILASHPSPLATVFVALLMLLCLPLWAVCLWPHALCYWLPTLMLKTDRMFTNTYRYVFSTLLIYPLTALATLLVMGLNFGLWWQALVWIALWPLTGKLGWWFYQLLKKQVMKLNYLLHPTGVVEAEAIRNDLSLILHQN